MAARECALRLAIGAREACPGASCQLWYEGACVLESFRPELKRSPTLSRHLLDLKEALECAAAADEEAPGLLALPSPAQRRAGGRSVTPTYFSAAATRLDCTNAAWISRCRSARAARHWVRHCNEVLTREVER